jgi:hypothetical protein
MILHLGQDVVVKTDDIIGIFDLEKATLSKRTKEFLAQATREQKIVTVSYEMPKSFVVTKETCGIRVYISQISALTLRKRALGLGKISD